MPRASDADGSTHRISPARLAEFREPRFGLFIHWARPDVAVPVIELFL
jgi:hypothetical protein